MAIGLPGGIDDRRRSVTRGSVSATIPRRGRDGTIVPPAWRGETRPASGSIVPSRPRGARGSCAAEISRWGRGGSTWGTHQGARNLTKAALPLSKTSVSKLEEVRSTAPALAPSTRPMRAIARSATRILIRTCGGVGGADRESRDENNSRDPPTVGRCREGARIGARTVTRDARGVLARSGGRC